MKAQIGFARILHLVSAVWVLGLAVLVCGDVLGRTLMSRPIPGTKEIVQNSIVTITFLQLPLAIFSGAMLRTPILTDMLPPMGRRILRTFAMLLGLAFFLMLIWGTWPSFQSAWRIGEYEGEGALRVPTWPVRGSIAAMSVLASLAYLSMIWLDWTGRLVDEIEAPGAVPRLEN